MEIGTLKWDQLAIFGFKYNDLRNKAIINFRY